jgi:hypothetical protein
MKHWRFNNAMLDGHAKPDHADHQQRQAERDRNGKALFPMKGVHLLLRFIDISPLGLWWVRRDPPALPAQREDYSEQTKCSLHLLVGSAKLRWRDTRLTEFLDMAVIGSATTTKHVQVLQFAEQGAITRSYIVAVLQPGAFASNAR